MTRTDAENTFREVARRLMSVEHQQVPALHARLHGATLLVTQALATSLRMSEGEALAALAKAADAAAERLLARRLDIPDPMCAAVIESAGTDLLALAHRYALTRARAVVSPAPHPGAGVRSTKAQ